MAKRFDTAVVGATPAGISAAVRAAREGWETLLVSGQDRIGGMMAGGLSYTDTMTMKARAPLFESFVESVREHYRSTAGPDATAYERCENGYVFEPHAAASIFEELVDEPALTVWRSYRPIGVERDGRRITSVTLEDADADGDGGRTVAADSFVDATYEGDLAATAGVPYSIGRESRREYDEQFAGRLFVRGTDDRAYPRAAVGDQDNAIPAERTGAFDIPEAQQQGDIDLIPHPFCAATICSGSTGEGDDALQAYNYRFTLCCDPDNRRLPEQPDRYDREEYTHLLGNLPDPEDVAGWLPMRLVPNGKADLNTGDLPGENHDYLEAGPERRAKIERRHREYLLGYLYFLQNDDAIPADVRAAFREWGLPTDEFLDNDNLPPIFYVREGRRIDGRYTFTEDDARVADGIDRTPIHRDSIAIAEYPLDSHACTTDEELGCMEEGSFFASSVTRPSQVPYRAMVPSDLDNLLCPVPLSATHIGFSTLRLEPTWMHIGEVAGLACAQGHERDVTPANVSVPDLQRRFLELGGMITFCNEFDMRSEEPWVEAVQFCGTLGFFDEYSVRPEAPLDAAMARHWIDGLGAYCLGQLAPTALAEAATDGRGTVTAGRFATEVATELDAAGLSADVGALLEQVEIEEGETISRGQACMVVYTALAEQE